MDRFPFEIIGVTFMAILLVGLAVFYGWRQLQTFFLLPRQKLPPEDHRFYHRQAWRRLICSGLMVLLACLLAGWFALGLDRGTRQLGEQAEQAAAAQEPRPPLAPHQKQFLNFSLTYTMVTLLIVLLLLSLAVLDFLAIRRFGLRHYRQLQADRRAMIEREVETYRSQRNGQ